MIRMTSLQGTMEELAVGGRGSKGRRRKREGPQRGEINRRWLLVVGWRGERGREKIAETGKGVGFLVDFELIFFLLKP